MWHNPAQQLKRGMCIYWIQILCKYTYPVPETSKHSLLCDHTACKRAYKVSKEFSKLSCWQHFGDRILQTDDIKSFKQTTYYCGAGAAMSEEYKHTYMFQHCSIAA